MITIPEALQFLRPGEKWYLKGKSYTGLQWFDTTTKPTSAEITQAKTDLQTHLDSEEIRVADIDVAKTSSGIKSVTVAQAHAFIDTQIDSASTVAEIKSALKTILKKMVVHIIN